MFESWDGNDINNLIGMSGRDKGFMSCGSAKGTGFTSKDVILTVVVPKGSECMFVSPVSKFGGDKGVEWYDELRMYHRVSTEEILKGQFEKSDEDNSKETV